jgi:hypothetical protein
MPFKSKAQRAYLYANNPEVAKEFEKKTPKGAKLPQKVAKKENDDDIEESFVHRIDAALGLLEQVAGAAQRATLGASQGISKGSLGDDDSPDRRKKRKKAKKVESEVLEAG